MKRKWETVTTADFLSQPRVRRFWRQKNAEWFARELRCEMWRSGFYTDGEVQVNVRRREK